MNRFSSNAVLKETPEWAPDGSKETCQITRRSMVARQALTAMPAKHAAYELEIKERTVNKWKAGESIPESREVPILLAAKSFFLDQHTLEDAIDQELLAAYGPHDKGRF